MGVYPGLGMPLKHFPQGERGQAVFPIGSHTNVSGSKSEMLPVREVAMMMVMDRLTDKADWHKKVFDDTIVAKWRDEALAIPDDELYTLAARGKKRFDAEEMHHETYPNDFDSRLKRPKGIISGDTFNWCVEELRDKARYFEETGLIPTLDATATVVKSDVLVGDELRESLRKAFRRLHADQAVSPDWHPGSDNMVQDLVHPSMYPLVYGRTRVLEDEIVGVADAIEKWAGKGDIIKKEATEPANRPADFANFSNVPPTYWSSSYQWLPANVAFQEDRSVKLTSYINNLHPKKYPEIYRTIEKLIETVLPAWDQCLKTYKDFKRYGPGRIKSRFSIPDHPDDENPENWCPSDPAELADVEVDFSKDRHYDHLDTADTEAERKWMILREPVLTSPDSRDCVDFDYKVDGGLQKQFKDSGLQVIVKMASIELTPQNPNFPVGGWHIEGQMNERICATALYYVDSENITDSSLSFRMQTSSYQDDDFVVGQDSYGWLEMVYGTRLGSGTGGSCLQNYGSVNTCQGRILTFPNVFQHRVSPFSLADPTKPGHRRFIALWLVDPHVRIISTANVPPQQLDWWVESVFGLSSESQESAASKIAPEMIQLLREKGVSLEAAEHGEEGTKLPAEVVNMVRKLFDEAIPMSLEEAKEHRSSLMEARTTFHDEAEGNWEREEYSFCEH